MTQRYKISFLLNSKEIFDRHLSPFFYVLCKNKTNSIYAKKSDIAHRHLLDLEKHGFAIKLKDNYFSLVGVTHIDNIPGKERFYCGLKTMEINSKFLKALLKFALSQNVKFRKSLIVRVYYLLYYRTQLYLSTKKEFLIKDSDIKFVQIICNRRPNEIWGAIRLLQKFGAIKSINNNLYILNQFTDPPHE